MYGVPMNTLHPSPHLTRAISRWLMLLIGLVVLMVAIGGVTRLTESGLSIVEWKLVSGTLPPMSETAWQAEFDEYKTSPQFQQVNKGFALSDFKEIFWLEYLHRLLGRIIGMVALIGTFYFGIRRVPRQLLLRLIGISALVGAQGTVGWIMVASGLENQPRVEPLKLGLHLLLAFALFASLLWTRWQVLGHARPVTHRGVARESRALLVLVLIQIWFGALVAGLRAGLTYNTYPLMDGKWVPEGIYMLDPLWKNHLENITMVQFQHRMGAYIVALCVILFVIYAWKKMTDKPVLKWLVGAVTLQFALGVATLLTVVNLWLASAHQLVALLLYSIIIRILYLAPLSAKSTT